MGKGSVAEWIKGEKGEKKSPNNYVLVAAMQELSALW